MLAIINILIFIIFVYLVIHGAKLQTFLNGVDRIFKDKITKITDYTAESNLHFALENRLKNYQGDFLEPPYGKSLVISTD